jgi:hypothetical protein
MVGVLVVHYNDTVNAMLCIIKLHRAIWWFQYKIACEMLIN